MTAVPALTTVSSYGAAGASTRVRVLDWVRHLQLDVDDHSYLGTASLGARQLHEAGPRRVVAAERDLRRLSRVRVPRLLLSREASPFSRGGLEEALLSGAGRGVLDLDDGLPWDHRPVTDPARWFSKPVKIRRAARAADLVVAGSPALLEWASGVARDAVLVPSCVEPAEYERCAGYELRDPPRITWLGSPATEPLLEPVVDALLRVHRATGARLRVISSGSRSLGRLDPVVDRVEWSPATVAGHLADTDVAIAPMPDTAYTRAKCAYKVLQYGCAALPVVVSPVGANADAAAALHAVAVEDPDDWSDALLEILGEPSSARARRGADALAGVTASYSFSVWADTWRAAVGLGTP